MRKQVCGGGRGNGRDWNGGCSNGRGCGGNNGNIADQENHANMEEDAELGGNHNDNTKTDAYSEASFSISTVEQLVLLHGLPLLWLLLDSCSTADIFANGNLLTDIHDASNRIKLTKQGYFGNYSFPVWYNPKGVANPLSLDNMTKHYCITMDTAKHSAMGPSSFAIRESIDIY